MSKKFLHREDAPFSEELWEKIDTVAIEAAKNQLSARQILHVDEPYGFGVKLIEGSDMVQDESTEASISSSKAIPVVQIQKSFSIPMRDIANFEKLGHVLNLKTIAEAAIACAKQEETILYNGLKSLGITGLFNTPGTESIKLQSWDSIGTAADDIIKAVTKLDDAGFHGPYSLGLAPRHFNLLYRRYPNGNMTELEHLKTIITEKIVKAPYLSSGGVMIAYGRQYASLILGQDLITGFIGPAEAKYEFNIFETIALRILQPSAICVLK